jgi:hypothetical protein
MTEILRVASRAIHASIHASLKDDLVRRMDQLFS